MSGVLESPASPNAKAETIYIYASTESLNSPTPRMSMPSSTDERIATATNSTSFGQNGRTSFRAISPPSPKRPRLEPSSLGRHSSDPSLKFRLSGPQQPAPEPRRKLPFSLGSSSSLSRSSAPPTAPERRPGYGSVNRSVSSQSLLRDEIRNTDPRHYLAPNPGSVSIPSAPREVPHQSSSHVPSGTQPMPTQSASPIPTAPRAMLRYQASQWSEQPSTYQPQPPNDPIQRPVVTPLWIQNDTPNLINDGPISPGVFNLGDKTSSNGATPSASEISSVAPPRENCVNCRFPLAQNAILACVVCDHCFHERCKNDSRYSENNWTCARCIKRAAKKTKTSAAKSMNNTLTVPQASRNPTPTFGLPTRSRSRSQDPVQVQESAHSNPKASELQRSHESTPPLLKGEQAFAVETATPVETASPISQMKMPLSLAQKSMFLRDAAVKPGGNAFARAAQLRKSSGRTSSSLEPTTASTVATSRPVSRGSETEASMDLSDDLADFHDSEVITSTPFPKIARTSRFDDVSYDTTVMSTRRDLLSEEQLAEELIRDLAVDSVEIVPRTMEEVGNQQKVDKEALKEQVGFKGHESFKEIENPREQTTSESRVQGRSAPSNIIAKSGISSSPTSTTTNSPNKTVMQERKLPPGMKIKKKTASGLDKEKQKTQMKTKPSGVNGWARQFELAGCENPFQESGSRNEKLNHCEDLFQVFGKCPWDLVDRTLRPKRFNIKLLRALATLKTVLDRFEDTEQCLSELEKFVDDRRARERTANLVQTKLTSGDVVAFIEIVEPRPVKNVLDDDDFVATHEVADEHREKASTDIPIPVSKPQETPRTPKPSSRRPAAARKTVQSPESSLDEDQISADKEVDTKDSATGSRTEAQIQQLAEQADVERSPSSGGISAPASTRLLQNMEQNYADLLKGEDGQRKIAAFEVLDLIWQVAPLVNRQDDPLMLDDGVADLLRDLRSLSTGSPSDIRSIWLGKAGLWAIGHLRSKERASRALDQESQEQPDADADMSITPALEEPLRSSPCLDTAHEEGTRKFQDRDDAVRDPPELTNTEISAKPDGSDINSEQKEIQIDDLSMEHVNHAAKATQPRVIDDRSTSTNQRDATSDIGKAGNKENGTGGHNAADQSGNLDTIFTREQSVDTDDLSEFSELTELEHTPELPSQLKQTKFKLKEPRKEALMNATRSNDSGLHSSSFRSSGKKNGVSGSKASRKLTNFALRELILLALYVEPRRAHGDDVELPKMTSKAIVDFVGKWFPQFKDLQKQAQRENLYNSIAAQCSTHVSKGVLAKSSQIDPTNEKVYTVYYANTSSLKFVTAFKHNDLEGRWVEHLAEFYPHLLNDEALTLPQKRQLEVPETPLPKRQKHEDASSVATSTPRPTSKFARSFYNSYKSQSGVRAARKNGQTPRPASTRFEEDIPAVRFPISASRMKASNSRDIFRSKNHTPLDVRSSSPAISLTQSTTEGDKSPKAMPVRAPLRDEPQADVRDPLDDLLETSKQPNAEEQELLDLISSSCIQEAANDATKMAQKNFEVKDFFAHWPERHPRHVLFDSVGKIEEIRKRPNRRQMLGLPYRRADAITVYRPYAGFDETRLPRINSMSFDSILPRAASPKKKDSPRKRKMHRDDSNIYAADIDASALELTVMEPERKVGSWQEALDLPKELVPGFVTDFTAKKGKRLVMEVPLAVRGKSRNWFKALIPED